AGFTESVLAGRPVKVEFAHKTSGMDSEYDQIRVARAVYSVLADVVVTSESGATPSAETLSGLAAKPRSLTVAVTSAGVRTRVPGGFEQAVPGTMVMFTLIV